MDKFPQMLYRAGGSEPAHGGWFSTLIVANESELSDALANGWYETTPEAIAADQAAKQAEQTKVQTPAEPTRAELEQKASELGIKVDARWGDKRLAEAIAAKQAEPGG